MSEWLQRTSYFKPKEVVASHAGQPEVKGHRVNHDGCSQCFIYKKIHLVPQMRD